MGTRPGGARLLLLGGTRFLGRHVAEQALAAGHALTLLHRGRSAPALFPQARHWLADRDGDLSLLEREHFDAVIDTSAYVPRQVRAVAERLAGRVGRYLLVSTVSVYADLSAAGTDETAPTATLDDPATEQLTGASYGGLKRLCEEAALAGFGERALVARPGLIVGPHDPTGRFAWWLTRLQRGGDVLVPGRPEAPLQFIDARDAAGWMLRQVTAPGTDAAGPVYNLTGPATPLTMGGFFEAARARLNPSARLHWADADWLLREGVAPWTELPLWVPPDAAGLHQVDIRRALGAGLATRPVGETVADTAAWLASDPPAPADGAMARPPVGLAPEKEAGLFTRFVAGS
ncbi:MAG: NAD-dependent epimerase/dehydratase family protein [Burkholderiaceae bacterium]